jgi:hypothetical protein
LRISVSPYSPPSRRLSLLFCQVWTLYEFDDLENIIDMALKLDFDTEEALRLLNISLVCIPDSPKIKPSMSMVTKMLQGECVVSGRIMRPGLITHVMDLKVRMVEPVQFSLTSCSSTAVPWPRARCAHSLLGISHSTTTSHPPCRYAICPLRSV